MGDGDGERSPRAFNKISSGFYVLSKRGQVLSQSQFERWLALDNTRRKLVRSVEVDVSSNHFGNCDKLVLALTRQVDPTHPSVLEMLDLSDNNIPLVNAVDALTPLFNRACFPKLSAVFLYGNPFDNPPGFSKWPDMLCFISPESLLRRTWAGRLECQRTDEMIETIVDKHCQIYGKVFRDRRGAISMHETSSFTCPLLRDVYALDNEGLLCECPSTLWPRLELLQTKNVPAYLKDIIAEVQVEPDWIPRQLALDLAFRCRTGRSYKKDDGMAMDLFELCSVSGPRLSAIEVPTERSTGEDEFKSIDDAMMALAL